MTADEMIARGIATREAVERETGWRYVDSVEDDAVYAMGPVGQHRDSGILDVSNFAVVLADLRSIDDRVTDVSFGHWAVGWVEEILWPTDNPAVVEAVGRWVDALSDYPVADDMDYSEREYVDALETLTACYSVPDDRSHDVWSWLWDTYSYSGSEEYSGISAVSEAVEALGLGVEL